MSQDEKKSISLPLASGEAVKTAAKSRAEGGDIMSEIQKEIDENAVVMYMKGVPQAPMCGFSAQTSAILSSYGMPFYAVDILPDPEKRQAIKDFSNWPTIPQIYIKGEFVGGCDILTQLHESGELQEMLRSAFED